MKPEGDMLEMRRETRGVVVGLRKRIGLILGEKHEPRGIPISFKSLPWTEIA